MRTIFICAISLVLLFNPSSFAEDTKEIKEEDKFSYLKMLEYVTQLTQPIKRHLRSNNIELNFFGGILQGYDNNVNLDPDRKKDAFLETSLNTEFTYNYTDDVRLKVENYTTDLLYYNENVASLFDVYQKGGLEMDVYDDLFDMITLGVDYAFDYVLFPNDEDGTYVGNEVKVFAKHNIDAELYHKIGYRFLHKSFSHDKTLDGRKVSTSQLRKDGRNGMDYEMVLGVFDKAILKASLQLYRNNSNYQYYDYYDYWSFSVRPSCIFMFTEKLYASSSFAYQQRRYDDRLSSQNDEHVYDDTYTLNVSFLYDLTKSFTIAINYSYRENSSNEPLQKYSGSIWTGGLYYSF